MFISFNAPIDNRSSLKDLKIIQVFEKQTDCLEENGKRADAPTYDKT